MASGARITAVHVFLVVFVMATLFLGAAVVFMARDMDDLRASAAKANDAAEKTKDANRKLDDEIQALKNIIGHQLAEVGLGAQDGDVGTVLGALQADIQNYGGPESGANVSQTLQNLRTKIDSITVQKQDVDVLLADSQDQITKLQQQYEVRVQNHDSRAQTMVAEVGTLRNQKDEAIAAKQQEIQQIRAEYSQIQIAMNQMKDQYETQLKTVRDERDKLEKINEKLRREIDSKTKVAFERPDGEVQFVDHNSKTVWINLGSDDHLPKRANFSVYTKTNHGIGRGKDDIKGSIEVTRIIGPHQAEARILTDNLYEPITAGDPIYTPIWSPGQTENFAIVGLIDIDNDGVSDRDTLRQLVAAHGSKITTEVDDQGMRAGGKIDVNTKYLVIGKIPDASTVSDKETQQEFLKIAKMHNEMRDEAQLQGVREISLKDFLLHIGYTPTRRVWTPGNASNYTLKAGSRSTGVNETIGDRSSSGQVSGVFSGNRRLKQKASSGQTSGIYGRGSGR